MRITILGSGIATPLIYRNMSGYLLEADRKKILFDSGAGIIKQLFKLKVNLLGINHIFYTHFHTDHINDLPAIIFSNNYGNYRKKALNLYGPVGFKRYYNILMKKILKIKLKYDIKVKEMKNNSLINLNNLTIKSIKVKHSIKNSISYRVDYNNKSIVYGGDTDYCNNIIKISKNADLLILECSTPNNKKIKGHLTPSLCGKIATKAKAKKLVLTHFYPEYDVTDMKKQCSKEFKGKIILAKDLMKIKI